MAKDITELFAKVIDQARTNQEQVQSHQKQSLLELEEDFEIIKDQVRLLRAKIENHPKIHYFSIFREKIVIGLHTRANFPSAELKVQLYLPGSGHGKQGIYGYLPNGYEIVLGSVDEAVEFIAVQCGKRLA